MLKIDKKDIYNNDKISIGNRYIFTGEIKYGIEPKEVETVKSYINEIKDQFLTEVIVLDFSNLKRWDSLGIREVVPPIIELNEQLSKKGRTLIGIIGDRKSDIYAAAKDKHPDISEDVLPWFQSYEDFVKQVEED